MTVMEVFKWNACFITGLPYVDEQHHHLVDLINRFGRLITSQAVASDELNSVFIELADYAKYHFSEEEEMMATLNLDVRHREQHVASHNHFIWDITRLHNEISADNHEATHSLMNFLSHWLAYHILGIDQYMAKQVVAIKSGQLPEQAYTIATLIQDPAMDTLLTALNGLFQQVSERNHALELMNQTLEERVTERTLALREANQRLENLANTDTLTGLPNRRHALRSLSFEWEAATHAATPLACMMVDADGFKSINDTHGHDSGDVVLRVLSAQLRHAVRTDDMVYRLGGDEFLIICARTPLDGAMKLAETLRRTVATLRIPAGDGQWLGSISVGVAVRQPNMQRLEDLLKAADDGVYVAKRNGRNCVATIQG
ncbi:Bacteriohemerythrin [Gammaproteobacteria bacterium]